MLTDEELKSRALSQWANYIETGTVTLSAQDVQQQNQSRPLKERKALPDLSEEQRQMVARLRQLSINELSGQQVAPRSTYPGFRPRG